MSPAHVLEPTYASIKERLLKGEWPAGFRLDTARIAVELGVSKSPIRDSLNHLAGERMVEFTSGEGFHVPRLDETRLRDILDFHLDLLLMASRSADFANQPIEDRGESPVERAAACFRFLVRRAGNAELLMTITGLSDRLSPVRYLEPLVLEEPIADLDALDGALSRHADRREIRDILRRYHAVRKSNAGDFIRLLAGGT